MATGTTHTTAGSDWGKADFEAIYNCPDPRQYFTTLQPLDYQIPHHGQAVFRTLADALRGLRPDRAPLKVLDLCCSYGVNAALLNHRLDLTDLYARYAPPSAPDGAAPEPGSTATSGPAPASAPSVSSGSSGSSRPAPIPNANGLGPRQLADSDRGFYAGRRREHAVRMVGLDAAHRAVEYAREVGLLEAGFAENLEVDEPTGGLRRTVRDTDLITVTGGVGYISELTFDRLLGCMPSPPWVAAFVLRTVSYEPVTALLTKAGLQTEKITARTFRQRRFADAGERQAAFGALAAHGVDVEGTETDGFYHADLYLSRPAADVAALPLERLLPDVV
ncbi:hypothetical protein [Streptomyces sp. NPDC003077]|uniref:hypothetical protein n=1 Tax=Streptomyces sp. NPDC003077 TaxID=3154443 RepID=UPI0033AA0139